MSSSLHIRPFHPSDTRDVAAVIVPIQRVEFGTDVTLEDQPDLSDIRGFYQQGSGNFWVAECGGRIAGTIGLLLWAFFTAVSVVYGAAVAAQLEAVRAEGIAPPQEPPEWVANDAQQELVVAGTGGAL